MVRIELKEIVSNYDNKRKALNAVERGNKKTNPQYPYYGANGIVDFIDEYIFDEELLCIAEDGGNWGYKQNCSYIVNGKYWVNNHVHVLKPKKNVEIKYLMYYLNYTDLTSYITGTTRGKLTRTALDKIQINLPELEIQREIVIILDKINNLIEKNKKRIIYLEKLVKSRFIEMFGDLIKNDKGWEIKKLGEVTNKISSGATPTGGKENYEISGISLIRSMNVHNGYFEYKDLAYISNEQARQLKNVEVELEDILLNITGASIARNCLVPSNIIPARVNQHVMIIRIKNKILNSIFLNNLFLNNVYKQKLINLGEANGATRQALTKIQIEKLEIILPPLSLQNEFAEFVTKTNKLKFEAEKSLKDMENLYESLMQKFFK